MVHVSKIHGPLLSDIQPHAKWIVISMPPVKGERGLDYAVETFDFSSRTKHGVRY